MAMLPVPEEGLVASVDEVALRLGLPDGLTEAQTARIEAALWDAQADVEDALNRPLLPVPANLVEQLPNPFWNGDLYDPKAFLGLVELYEDDVRIVTRTAQADGTFNLAILVGIDARTIPGIRSHIVRAAIADVVNDPASGMGERVVSNLSAEGQSISWESSSDKKDTPASRLEKLALRWGRRSAYVRPSATLGKRWPYN